MQNYKDKCTDWLARVEIRHLKRVDLPALEWDGEYRHFRRLYSDIYRDMYQDKALMWVAELPTVGLIAQLFVQFSSSRAELADGLKHAYIYGFRVKPLYRGNGLGSRILQIVEVDLARRHFRWANLNVSRDNQAARRFYEYHGYRVIAEEPGRWSYLDDQGRQRHVHEPAWRMQKKIA
jgi:ribosomal protein S18 acetylase RimI-like enzyme